MSAFEPVFLPDDIQIGDSVSMTLARLHNNCPRSGFLYALHRRTRVQNVAMLRGSAGHTIYERATREAIAQGEERIPPEVAKAIVNEVLASSPLPVEEHDYLREQAYRWAGEWRLPPDEEVVAVERLFVLELGGMQVRCKVDFASKDARNALYVADFKTGRGAPSYDAISRKRPEGQEGPTDVAAKQFQLILYVLALAFGRPACETCHGEGVVRYLPDGSTDPQEEMEGGCSECDDGLLPEPVARGCPEAIVEYVFPGIEADGRMLRRTVGLTRLEMLEYHESLEAQFAQIPARVQSGDWPAVVSDAACGECPCPADCPIDPKLRGMLGTINTESEARVALQARYRARDESRAMGRELRLFIEKQLGGSPLRYGNRVAEIVPRPVEELRDRDGMIAALAAGMPEAEAREKFIRSRVGTQFVERDLQPDEIEGGK